MTTPLAGFSAHATGRSQAAAHCLGLLSGLGAGAGPMAETDRPGPTPAVEPEATLISVSGAGRRAGARLLPLRCDLAELGAAGLPGGVTDLALGRTLATAALAGWMAGRDIDVDPLTVLMLLHLPAVMAASYGSAWWPEPPAPLPAPGGGWLNADLGAPGDTDAFARLLGSLSPDATAADIATEAQVWRLPVCDYRAPAPGEFPPWRPAPSGQPAGRGAGEARTPVAVRPPTRAGRPALEGITVCDLTSMWAGPLATWLLVQLGARVIKVEPPSRPDGTRGLSGRGIRPGGRTRGGRGEDSGTFNALNAGKDCVSLDAREDRASLRGLAASADLVIDSFSPRVMPQLGLDRDSLPQTGAVTLSMPAFPPGPWRQWVAYGNGIHALSGLGGPLGEGGDGVPPGHEGAGGPAVPTSSYPDPLAGLEAAATAVAALAGRAAGWKAQHLEVSLAGTVEPLMTAPPGPWPRAEAAVGPRLLAAARVSGAAVVRRGGAGIHLYPGGPFREHTGAVGTATSPSPAGVDP
ncbi:MAG: CoA transferase [Acidimicrobiales bacterium]